MLRKAEILDVSFVIVAMSHNPTILNEDFLIRKSLTTEEWELASAPVCAYPYAQVQFSNGVSIVAQPDRITFSHSLAGTSIQDAQEIARLASGYINALPEVDYRQLGFNINSFVPLTASETKKNILPPKFIKDGPWLSFQGVDAGIGLRFVYPTTERRLTINLEQGTITVKDDNPRDGIVLSGNFHRDYTSEKVTKRLGSITSAIAGWETDLSDFTEFIGKFFEAQEQGKRKHA